MSCVIAELKSEVERGGWISVDDRLPERIVPSVMAVLKNNSVMEMQYSPHTCHWFKVGLHDEYPDNPVTHWQPQPKPPPSEDL